TPSIIAYLVLFHSFPLLIGRRELQLQAASIGGDRQKPIRDLRCRRIRQQQRQFAVLQLWLLFLPCIAVGRDGREPSTNAKTRRQLSPAEAQDELCSFPVL
ncbi:unnamed protein product, partial [Linum tenue]